MKRTAALLVLLSLLALSVSAFAAVPAPAAQCSPASAPAPAFLATSTTMSCADFCARAYCVQGTTCGIDPKTGKCGCYPSDVLGPSVPASPVIDSSAR